MTTITIPAHCADACKEALDALIKRANRYGQEITYTVEFTSERRLTSIGRYAVVPVAAITVTGDAPRCGNHRFIAKMTREGEGVIVNAALGEEGGEQAYNWDGSCAHCGSKRPRVHGFLLQGENGERVIIGRSCVRDYLGRDLPESIISSFNVIRQLNDCMDEFAGSSSASYRTPTEVIFLACAAINIEGYLRADESTNSTISVVRDMLAGITPRHPIQIQRRAAIKKHIEENTDALHQQAQDIIAWVAQTTPNTDYGHNMKLALASDYISDRLIGVAVSAPKAYASHLGRLAEQNASTPSEYLGNVGERMILNLKVTKVVSFEGMYGYTHINICRDADNNVVVYKGSGRWNEGERYAVKATVKAHEARSGVNQTLIARPTLI